MTRRAGLMLLLFIHLPALADKVIMKDGKIVEGRIMGETNRSLLIRTNSIDAKPVFLNLRDVQTVVRESQPPEAPSEEAGRFAAVELSVMGTGFTSNVFDFDAGAGLNAAGNFRLHPLVEVGAGVTLWPDLAGAVAVTDGTSARGYRHFMAWSGGFHTRLFPLYRVWDSRFEPYLMGGYHWNRLNAKGSGDHFNGHSWMIGPGLSWQWTRALCWDTRILYQDVDYDEVKFQTGTGSVSGVGYGSWTFSTGLSWRFL